MYWWRLEGKSSTFPVTTHTESLFNGLRRRTTHKRTCDRPTDDFQGVYYKSLRSAGHDPAEGKRGSIQEKEAGSGVLFRKGVCRRSSIPRLDRSVQTCWLRNPRVATITAAILGSSVFERTRTTRPPITRVLIWRLRNSSKADAL